ncbi:MAG TPA: YjjG family noncanonical pyrimidine nucleotidase [Cytophagaceae bacterium]|jgi:putative hydrolase of the HAD superfamily
MKSPYKHILFDLDHTLWDFDKNCSETLEELYQQYNLSTNGFSLEDLIVTYKHINSIMWKDYHHHKISKEEIRSQRFVLTFKFLGVDERRIPAALNDDFMRICPTKSNLIPYAREVLSYLKDSYQLHILTNGFKESQDLKINSSQIRAYFKEIINSEICGFLKPDKKMFDFAINKIAAEAKDCVMIGDDLVADVLGAKGAGIDHVYYNPLKTKHSESLTYEINCLSELKSIL